MAKVLITYLTNNGRTKKVIKEVYNASLPETTQKFKKDNPYTCKHVIEVEYIKEEMRG